ncbi:hypothetical protein [Nocardioides sp. WS12]|uniref:hypothetical protein n=1 Tax=Nocardioides sp. WS12 TaxID=2486272 RepID=UPI0015F7B999|nr:hypothetical protein [Nocardioides sp. WS12]
MAWDRRRVAVIRAWGLAAGLAAGVVLAGVTLVVSDVYLDLPTLRDRVRIVHVFPGLAAVVLPFPLVDRTPGLTLMSARPPVVLALFRLGGVLLTSAPVVAALLLVGWTLPGALVVVAFLGIAAAACALAGLWYWVPMMGLLVVWLQWGSREEVVHAGGVWLSVDVALFVVGSALYVALECGRVRSLTREAGTSSGRRRGADTIRP